MEKRKYILSMLLLIATCLFSNNAFAYDALIDGIYYNFNGDKMSEIIDLAKKTYLDETFKKYGKNNKNSCFSF